MSDTIKQRLTTVEATITPGERAQLVTPITESGFLIESMMTTDNGLLYASLRAEVPTSADAIPAGILSRIWKWWTGGDNADPVRIIYDAEATSEDADDEQPRPQDFEDFMLSLIRGGTTFEASEDGTPTAIDADDQDEDERIQLPAVHAGERLLLNVFNPTADPITAKVTFSGPEFSVDEPTE